MSQERLSIFYVSPMPASPPRFGAQARLHGLMTHLARRHEVTAAVLVDDEFDVLHSIYDLLRKMSPVDLVLIEGFKSARHARIEVYRSEVGKPPFHPENPHVVGIVSDTPFPDAGRPVVDIDDVEAVVELVLAKAERLDAVLARVRAEAVGEA